MKSITEKKNHSGFKFTAYKIKQTYSYNKTDPWQTSQSIIHKDKFLQGYPSMDLSNITAILILQCSI